MSKGKDFVIIATVQSKKTPAQLAVEAAQARRARVMETLHKQLAAQTPAASQPASSAELLGTLAREIATSPIAREALGGHATLLGADLNAASRSAGVQPSSMAALVERTQKALDEIARAEQSDVRARSVAEVVVGALRQMGFEVPPVPENTTSSDLIIRGRRGADSVFVIVDRRPQVSKQGTSIRSDWHSSTCEADFRRLQQLVQNQQLTVVCQQPHLAIPSAANVVAGIGQRIDSRPHASEEPIDSLILNDGRKAEGAS